MKKKTLLFVSSLLTGIATLLFLTLVPELYAIGLILGIIGIICFINFMEADTNKHNQVDFDYTNEQKLLDYKEDYSKKENTPGKYYCCGRCYWI